jgi:hypothetical protein
MTDKARFGEFQVVHLDSARHRHRGVKQFAVRDARQNYMAYCSTEREAEERTAALDEDSRIKKAAG